MSGSELTRSGAALRLVVTARHGSGQSPPRLDSHRSSTTKAAMAPVHQPVLVDEVVAWLSPREGSILVDGTVGGGGHVVALASRVGSTGRLIGLDRDPAMLALALESVQGSSLAVTLVHAAYSEIRQVLDELGIGTVDGVLLDLGLSSDQLAWRDRGFSFASDGPLDMRFDPEAAGSDGRRPGEPTAGGRGGPVVL